MNVIVSLEIEWRDILRANAIRIKLGPAARVAEKLRLVNLQRLEIFEYCYVNIVFFFFYISPCSRSPRHELRSVLLSSDGPEVNNELISSILEKKISV